MKAGYEVQFKNWYFYIRFGDNSHHRSESDVLHIYKIIVLLKHSKPFHTLKPGFHKVKMKTRTKKLLQQKYRERNSVWLWQVAVESSFALPQGYLYKELVWCEISPTFQK